MKTYYIDLSNLRTPREICPIMERNVTKQYTYVYQTAGSIFNCGKAADKEWMTGTWGNRTYRKAGGIRGWPCLLSDTSAAKMTELMDQYLPEVCKNDVIITINDYTQDLVNEVDDEIDRFLLNEENKLIRQFEHQFGCLPLLNIQNTRAHPKPMFADFFS